jgi:hypothetical protein
MHVKQPSAPLKGDLGAADHDGAIEVGSARSLTHMVMMALDADLMKSAGTIRIASLNRLGAVWHKRMQALNALLIPSFSLGKGDPKSARRSAWRLTL